MSNVYPRLKPEFAATHVREFEYEFRLRTPEEREEYERQREAAERERTRGWPLCQCCDRRKPLGDFLIHELLVCCDCVDRGQRYGRPWRRRTRVPAPVTSMWFLNAAMAITKELERECRNMHNRGSRMDRLIVGCQPILTLPNSPET